MIKGLLRTIVAAMMIFVPGCIGFGSIGADAPTNLYATPQASQVALTWNAVTVTGSTETVTYNVYRGTSSGDLSTKTKIAPNLGSPTYLDTAVLPGVAYYYQVTSVVSSGESQGSNQVSITITVATGDFNLTAAVKQSQVVLNWYVFTGATGYNVYRSTIQGTATANTSPIASNVSLPTYTDTAVISGQTYYYRVTAITPTGVSPDSNEAIATP